MKSSAALVTLATLGFLVGCGAPPDGAPATSEPAAAAGDAREGTLPITTTLVYRHADGTETTTAVDLTRDEQLGLQQARGRGEQGEAPAAAPRTPEALAPYWWPICLSGLVLYDGPNGTGNMLCLGGNPGTHVDLTRQCHVWRVYYNPITGQRSTMCAGDWNGHIVSYESVNGNAGTWFTHYHYGDYCNEYVQPSTALTNADHRVMVADGIDFVQTW